jgi:hypothetical protein
MKKSGAAPLPMYRKKKYSVGSLLVTILHVAIAVPMAAQNVQEKVITLPASVIINASDQYSNPSVLQSIFMGKNYRKEWATPVTLPVFDIKALHLTVTGLGGGKQTKSLRLKDADSVEWALRTVDKDVRPAIPKIIRNKFTVSIVQDLVSAAHPFAPLTIPMLAKAVGVHAASPQFYYVPGDTALGKYHAIFANMVCLLEKRDILPGVKTEGTVKMLDDVFDNHKAALSQEAFLNARLLDMLIADWDRHYDQWKWAGIDSGGRTIYLPLPKDRDQAYFYSQGWLLKAIRLFGMKFSVGFTPETDNIVDLNSVALTLDQLLLNGLGRGDWQRIAHHFQQQLSDDVIRAAVKEMPAEQYAIHGKTITEKLLSRKATLPDDVMKYYVFLAKKVTVYGTDKAEQFSFTGNRDSLTLTISDTKGEGKIYYQRTFYPKETKKITLLGLDGDDIFVAEKGLQTDIKVKIDGGKGKNEYKIDQSLPIKVKDSDMDAKDYQKKLRKPLRVRD